MKKKEIRQRIADEEEVTIDVAKTILTSIGYGSKRRFNSDFLKNYQKTIRELVSKIGL